MKEPAVGADAKVAFVAALVLAVIAALIDNGGLGWMIGPIVLLLAWYAMARVPIRVSMLVLMFLALTLENPSENPAAGQWKSPLFTLGAGLNVALYPFLDELPVQAGPGFVDLYRRMIGGTLREVALATGRETALGMMQQGQGLAALEHPVVASFDITPEGRVAGDPVASPDALTDGVARWITEVLIAASDHHGIDPAAVIEKVGRDSRFVLQEQGFFARLPWALAI